MASLSRRLTVIAERGKSGNYGISDALVADLESAAAVFAAVEAFQAAEQAYRVAESQADDDKFLEAQKNWQTAKAGLLDVDLS